MCGTLKLPNPDDIKLRHVMKPAFVQPDFFSASTIRIGGSLPVYALMGDELVHGQGYWGLGDYPFIRSETVDTTYSFVNYWQAQQRAIVPIQSFNEQGVWFQNPQDVLYLAGLWHIAQRPAPQLHFALLTMAPSTAVQPVHHRQPMPLPLDQAVRWLTPGAVAIHEFTAAEVQRCA